jgi:tetratricopeptide (TPR) repeat protein
VLVLVSMAMPVHGQMQGAVGDWGDQYRYNLGKPEYGWLEEGFKPVGASNGRLLFVKSDGWNDYEYFVPVDEVIEALDAGYIDSTVVHWASRAAGRSVMHNVGNGFVANGLAESDPSVASFYFSRAIWAYDEAITSNPEDIIAWIGKGNALYYQEKYGEAILAYDEAIRLDPQSAIAWNNKGEALYYQGQYDEALQCFDEAIKLDPEYTEAWNNKGVAFEATGRTSEADAAYVEAQRLQVKTLGP